MTVRELATQLKLEVCCGAAGLDKEIKGGYTSDLLRWVTPGKGISGLRFRHTKISWPSLR